MNRAGAVKSIVNVVFLGQGDEVRFGPVVYDFVPAINEAEQSIAFVCGCIVKGSTAHDAFAFFV